MSLLFELEGSLVVTLDPILFFRKLRNPQVSRGRTIRDSPARASSAGAQQGICRAPGIGRFLFANCTTVDGGASRFIRAKITPRKCPIIGTRQS